jgi:hypothetical protein
VSLPRLAALATTLLGLAAVATGCAIGQDDELAPKPTRTITATPSQSLAPAPATVPVGQGKVSPADVVWAQGSELHVGRQQVDLRSVDVDALVVVRGGVFVLADGELWFTDLSRLRGTGQTDVVRLRVSEDADRIVVTDTRSGQPLDQAYDTRTGRAIRGQVDTLTPQQVRAGPGRYRVHTGPGGTSVVEVASGHAVSVAGLPRRMEVGGWTGDAAFFGLAGAGAKRTVVGCDLVRHRCSTEGTVTGSGPVVFGTGR